MKLTFLPSVITGLLFLALQSFFPASETPAQTGNQPSTFGTYRLSLPPGWQYDPGSSDDQFLAFFHSVNGKTDYVIKLKKEPVTCPTKKDFNREVVKIFYDLYAATDYVDRFKNEGDYGALGDQQSHFICFNLHGSNERGFIISPWVDGKMYNIYVYDKVDQKRELRPEALAFIGALTLNPGGTSSGEKLAVNAGDKPVPAANTQASKDTPGEAKTAPATAAQASPAPPANAAQGQIPSPNAAQAPARQANADQAHAPRAGTQPEPAPPASALPARKPASAAEPARRPLSDKKDAPAVIVPPRLLDFGRFSFESDIDFATMTSAQYTGAVSLAMEGMRLIYGEMTGEEENRFMNDWKPLFDYPCKEVVDYLNKLNPLISEFLALREAMGEEIESYNSAILVVTIAASEDDTAAMAETMAELEITVAILNTLQKQLQEVADEIASLGNPPDAAMLAEGKRKLHRKALSLISADNIPLRGRMGAGRRIERADESGESV